MSEKIPKGWKRVKLGDVTKINMGQSPKSEFYNTEGIGLPFLQGNRTFGYRFPKIDTYCSKPIKIAKNGEILFSVRAPVGDINIANQDICIGRGLAALKAKNDNNIFLFYLLHFLKREILNSEGGTVFGSINKKDLENLEILLPPLPEQKAIASVLSSLDDKIDLLHRQNQTLEKMAETLFREWFVKEFQRIEFNQNSAKNFKLDKFSRWIKGTIGGDWGKESPQGDYIKKVYCIRGTDIADLNTGLPLKTPQRFIKENKFKKIKPEEGDLIIEISGGTESQSTGRVTYINSDVEKLFDLPIVFSNFCRLIKVRKPEYSFFLYCYIKHLYNSDEFFNLENGTSGIKNLDYKTLLFELEYPMPSKKLVLEFNEAVYPLFKKINKNKQQIRTLGQLRDTLLPKLMSGEVRVMSRRDKTFVTPESTTNLSSIGA